MRTATTKSLLQLSTSLSPKMVKTSHYMKKSIDMRGHRWLFPFQRCFSSNAFREIKTFPLSRPVITSIYIPEESLDFEKTILIDLHTWPISLEGLLSTRLHPKADPCYDMPVIQKAINTVKPYIRMNLFEPGLMLAATNRLFIHVPKLYEHCFCEVVFLEENWDHQSFSMGPWCIEMSRDKMDAVSDDPTLDYSAIARIDRYLAQRQFFIRDPSKHKPDTRLNWLERIPPEEKHLLFF